jgi:hypothetical protein
MNPIQWCRRPDWLPHLGEQTLSYLFQSLLLLLLTSPQLFRRTCCSLQFSLSLPCLQYLIEMGARSLLVNFGSLFWKAQGFPLRIFLLGRPSPTTNNPQIVVRQLWIYLHNFICHSHNEFISTILTCVICWH